MNWRDLSSANSIELNLPDYKIVEADGSTANTVSATVWDWFGKTAPAGVDVDFWSNQASGLNLGQTNQTDGSGVAYSYYNWTSLLTADETISAATAGDIGDDVDHFYWVDVAANG